eukprot:Selendium_serpulae@DN3947_c0_g1_i2.p3
MNCIKEAVNCSLDYAYAHHIQRLMVLGNFCLLTGVDPSEVDRWFLGVYVDAIEWVEMPNVRGMATFADGGLLATKPYAASGAYINRMADYCAACRYDHKAKLGDAACPLNALYWHFMAKHRTRLSGNHRVAMAFGTWDRMDEAVRRAIVQKGDALLEDIE